MTVTEALVALGSNVASSAGSPAETIGAALGEIAEKAGVIRAQSRFFRTPAFPEGSGPDYVNAAVAITTKKTAGELLGVLHAIELRHGRNRRKRWASRTLDLDLLSFGDAVLPDAATFAHWQALPLERQKADAPDQLILPHPRLQERAFVLVPLNDVAPDWRHPVLGRTVAQMLADLDPAEIRGVTALN